MPEAGSRAVERGYEPDQPQLRGIALGAAGIVAAVIIAVTVGYFLRPPSGTSVVAQRSAPASSAVGAPRLQADPARDVQAFHAEKARAVGEYAWVDRRRGVVRIPIERAMELLVERQAAGRRPE